MTENRTIMCKKCGAEMPAGSVFCDSCGAALSSHGEDIKTAIPAKEKAKRSEVKSSANNSKERNSGTRDLVIAISIIVLILAGLALHLGGGSVSGDSDKKEETPRPEEQMSAMDIRITAEQYDQISFGMTYDDVVEILGTDGVVYYEDYYAWPGIYYGDPGYTYPFHDAYILLYFNDNGKLLDIRENNLYDAEEILENSKQEKESHIEVNEKLLKSIRSGMSYEEVCEIIGARGVLTESESDKNGYSQKEYLWRYNEEGDRPDTYFGRLEIKFVDGKAQRDSYSIWGK